MKIRIGYIIKKYREAHNYDQASLGRLAGISRGKVVYIENHRCPKSVWADGMK